VSTLTSLSLAPFALLLRLAYARPWTAIGVSAAAGLFAHLIGHDGWTALFICFLAYVLIWLDESENPSPATLETAEE